MKTLVGPLLILCLWTPSLWGQTFDWKPPIKKRPSGQWLITNTGYSFFSEANYTSSGDEFEKLPNQAEFSTLQALTELTYQATPRLAIFGGFGVGLTGISLVQDSDTQFGLNGVSVGATYLTLSGFIDLHTRLRAFFAIEEVDAQQTEALIGDGVHYFAPSFFLSKTWGRLNVFMENSFHIPGDGLAKLYKLGLGSEMDFSQVGFGAMIRRQMVIAEDQFSANSATRTNVTTNTNGGSLHFYATNPEVLDFLFYGKLFPSSNFDISAGILKTINGQNSSEGWGLVFSLEIAFNDGDEYYDPPAARSGKSKYPQKSKRPKKVRPEDFEATTEKLNETLFEDEEQYNDQGEILEETEELLEKRIQEQKKKSR